MADLTDAEMIRVLRSELSAAVGYMMNARIDLETGCTKTTAISTLSGGIKRFHDALARTTPKDTTERNG